LLAAVDTELKWMFIPGGQILFRENEVADSLYIVLIGCLGVIVRDNNGRDILVARHAQFRTGVGDIFVMLLRSGNESPSRSVWSP
jgi:CRP-like cAMP-binding protein